MRVPFFQFRMAFTFLSQSFPKMRTLSGESSTWKEVGTGSPSISNGTFKIHPKERTLLPFAVTMRIFDGSSILRPSCFINLFVMILVAAPLSITAESF